MELLFSYLSLAALAGFAVLMVRRTALPAPLAPFAALCATMLWFSAAGMLGVLVPAGWAYFALAAAAWVLSVRPAGAKQPAAALGAPGFAAFFVLAALLLAFFAWRQPMFSTWDEFSFWGTAAKIVKTSGGLYVNADIGWAWVGTHRPALVVLGWFFQFFGGYAEWRVLAGYDILLIAIFAALTAGCKKGAPRQWVPALGFGFLLPFVVTLYGSVTRPTDLYASALSDIPLGLTFGGALAVYYINEKKALWPSVLALAALCLEKDTGFALALVAAELIAADGLLGLLAEKAPLRRWARPAAGWAGLFIACGLSFLSWQKYLAVASTADTSNVGGTEQMGMAEMVITGVKELLGIGRTEKFSTIMGGLVRALFASKTTMVGPFAVVIALAFAMAAGAAILTKDKTLRRQAGLFAVLGTAGFAAYFFFIGLTYVYVFRDEVSDGLVGFERYMYPYLLGWLLAAAALVLRAMGFERIRGLLQTGFAALTLALAALVWLRLPFSLTVFGGGNAAYAQRWATRDEARQVQAAVPEDAHIFFVSQGDDGSRWFLYSYELYPWYLDYSGTEGQGGGGTFAVPGALEEDTLYYHPYTAEELLACIRERGCDYVFIERSDALFAAGYAALFSDGLAGCENQSAVYAWNEAEGQFDFVCNVGAKG